MTHARYRVVGLGELLWDMLPQGKQLGGAPANFAYMTALLGDGGIIASRVGEDKLGQEAIWQLKSCGLDTSQIQSDPSHVTSPVQPKPKLNRHTASSRTADAPSSPP